MRILIVQNEAVYFGGAERTLLYYLDGLRAAGIEAAVACVGPSKLWDSIPDGTKKFPLPSNQPFSIRGILRQSSAIQAHRVTYGADVVHAWSARSWDPTAFAGWRGRFRTLGTLHDHPQAGFHSRIRRWLMQRSASAASGLREVICVSDALRRACVDAQYPPNKLGVVHNGLPLVPLPALAPRTANQPFTIGFLGTFSELKGLHVFLAALDELYRLAPDLEWRAVCGGGAQDPADKVYNARLLLEIGSRPWFGRVTWPGWIKNAVEFIASVDILVLASTQFDSFPTVLLEAGLAGTPAVAANIGGVPEIVQDGQTGWLFPLNDWAAAGRILAERARQPAELLRARAANAERIRHVFTIERMVNQYVEIYRRVAAGSKQP